MGRKGKRVHCRPQYVAKELQEKLLFGLVTNFRYTELKFSKSKKPRHYSRNVETERAFPVQRLTSRDVSYHPQTREIRCNKVTMCPVLKFERLTKKRSFGNWKGKQVTEWVTASETEKLERAIAKNKLLSLIIKYNGREVRIV